MKKIYTLTLFSLLLSGAAQAQPVEAVPLSQPTYTMNRETDPMATDPGAAPGEKSINRGTTEIAPPPPGTDDQAGTSATAAPDTTPSPVYPPADFAPAQTPPPAGDAANAAPPRDYPNNNVSGVLPTDESKFEHRTFCTIKVSFSSIGTGVDNKTGEKVKAYLDSNADKLSYKRANWGHEGEYDYCIDVPAHNNRAKIYTGLKKLLPRRESRDERTVLSGTGFTRVTNSQ